MSSSAASSGTAEAGPKPGPDLLDDEVARRKMREAMRQNVVVPHQKEHRPKTMPRPSVGGGAGYGNGPSSNIEGGGG